MNKETPIAKRENAGALSTNIFEADANAGSQNMTQDDLALPFLKVLGQLSPEVNKQNAKLIKGAEAGMIVKLDLPDICAGSGFFEGTEAKCENRLDNLWIITSLKHIIELPRASYQCELILTNTMTQTSRELPIYEAPGTTPTKRDFSTIST